MIARTAALCSSYEPSLLAFTEARRRRRAGHFMDKIPQRLNYA